MSSRHIGTFVDIIMRCENITLNSKFASLWAGKVVLRLLSRPNET